MSNSKGSPTSLDSLVTLLWVLEWIEILADCWILSMIWGVSGKLGFMFLLMPGWWRTRCWRKSFDPEYIFLHMRQENRFSPRCLRMWSISFDFRTKVLSQSWHLWGRSPVWQALWNSNLSLRLNPLPHSEQVNLLRSLWISTWLLRLLLVMNLSPQTWHNRGLERLWNRLWWFVRYTFFTNLLPHMLQMNVCGGFSWLLILCFCKDEFKANFLSHSVHQNGCWVECDFSLWRFKSFG